MDCSEWFKVNDLNLHAYVDNSGFTDKFKTSHVGWTLVRQRAIN